MAVPYTFGTATAAIPLSQLDTNFATAITLGNTAVYLGNTTTSIGNLTLTNVTISSGSVTITDTTVSGNVTLSGGTANGVAYLNGSKVLTTGSALTFDGTNLGVGTSSPIRKLSVSNSGAEGLEIGPGSINGDASGAVTSVYYNRSTSAYVNAIQNANSFIYQTSGTEGMRLTSTGLGIGTSSPSYKLDVNGSGNIFRIINSSTSSALMLATNSGASSILVLGNESTTAGSSATGSASYAGLLFTTGAKPLQLGTNSVIQATLDTSGNLGLGVTPSAWSLGKAFEVGTVGNCLWGAASADVRLLAGIYYNSGFKYAVSSLAVAKYEISGGNHTFYTAPSGTAGNAITFTQAMTLDASGNLLVGTTSNPASARANISNSTTGWISSFYSTSATLNGGVLVTYSSAAPNNTGSEFVYCQDSSALRMSVRSNGGIANYAANNVILSDRREKTNFAPAKSYLETICAIPVQTFNYINQNMEDDGGLTLGVIAQDVQAIAPELVTESNWGTKEDPKMRLEIYQTDLQYALMKALQELKAEFDAYKSTHP